jgi:hypothetical protein
MIIVFEIGPRNKWTTTHLVKENPKVRRVGLRPVWIAWLSARTVSPRRSPQITGRLIRRKIKVDKLNDMIIRDEIDKVRIPSDAIFHQFNGWPIISFRVPEGIVSFFVPRGRLESIRNSISEWMELVDMKYMGPSGG